mgnify:CR=1 FL=1
MAKVKVRKKLHPYMFIILTFLGVIAIGTILLLMPFASSSGESFGFVDSFFMATSAVCVTGLSVMKNGLGADMSIYGKVVMAMLMEIGGLSIITIAVFFFTIIKGKIGISNGLVLKESLNQNTMKDILSLVKNIVRISFSIQIICAFLNWYPFYEYLGLYGDASLGKAFLLSLFHSDASFNNAGFDIVYGTKNFVDFALDAGKLSTFSVIVFNLTTVFLIFSGGIGFVVIQDVLKKKRWKKFSLHTKITLIMTFILIIGGTLLIKFTANISFIDALFTSVTSRTAGFQTYDMMNLETHPATYYVIIILMFIGASPCSTGGGIKTTTMAVALIAIYHFAFGRKSKVFSRRLDNEQVIKAFVLITLAVMIVMSSTFVVVLIQPELGIDKTFFEIVSAFSTTGLSMGITTSLNVASKLIVCFLMIFGRIGILTIIGVVNKNWLNKSKEEIEYVKESVIIG